MANIPPFGAMPYLDKTLGTQMHKMGVMHPLGHDSQLCKAATTLNTTPQKSAAHAVLTN